MTFVSMNSKLDHKQYINGIVLLLKSVNMYDSWKIDSKSVALIPFTCLSCVTELFKVYSVSYISL